MEFAFALAIAITPRFETNNVSAWGYSSVLALIV